MGRRARGRPGRVGGPPALRPRRARRAGEIDASEIDPDDARQLRETVPEILDVVRRLLAKVRAGELGIATRGIPRRRAGARARRLAVTDPFVPSAGDLLRWAETLSGIARTGLAFTKSLYEQERFDEVLKVAADIRASAIEEAQAETLYDEWAASIGEGVHGYVTPKVAVAAVVGNEKGELLLTQRADSGCVAVPGRVRRRRLLAVGDRGERGVRGDRHRGRTRLADRGARRSAPRLHAVPAVLAVVPLPDDRAASSAAIRSKRSAVGFFARDNLPWPVAGIQRWGEFAFAAIDGKQLPASFEPPRTPPWRGLARAELSGFQCPVSSAQRDTTWTLTLCSCDRSALARVFQLVHREERVRRRSRRRRARAGARGRGGR